MIVIHLKQVVGMFIIEPRHLATSPRPFESQRLQTVFGTHNPYKKGHRRFFLVLYLY